MALVKRQTVIDIVSRTTSKFKGSKGSANNE